MTKTAVAMDNGASVPTKVMKYRARIGRSEFEIKTAKGAALPPGRPPGEGDGPVQRPRSSSPGTWRSPLRSRIAGEPASGGGRGTAGAMRRPNPDGGPRSVGRAIELRAWSVYRSDTRVSRSHSTRDRQPVEQTLSGLWQRR